MDKSGSWPLKTVIEQTVTFGRGGNGTEFQSHGWSGTEKSHTWTLGKESGLVLPAPNAPFGYFLEIDAGAYIVEPWLPHQNLTIVINGKRVASIQMQATAPVAVLCPPPDGDQLVITFKHPDAKKPSGGPGDDRPLALAVFELRIMSLTEPVAEHRIRSSHFQIREPEVESALQKMTQSIGLDAHDLLSIFEMLAGDCTMGLVVRILGEEPLSLLRFAGATERVAIRGLDTSFELLGETLEPRIVPQYPVEWMMSDAIGLWYHTGQPPTVDRESVVLSERRKLRFLRRKIIEDLSETRKIFVFDDREKLPIACALPLFLALRRHGPHRMLWATPAGTENRGRVDEILPGFFRGGLDPSMEPSRLGLPVGGWLALFMNAWSLAN